MGWRGPVTNRQFKAWLAWRNEVDFFTPDKQAVYAAQIAYQVACLLPDYCNASSKDSKAERPDFTKFLFREPGSKEAVRRDSWGNELTERGVPKIEVSEATFRRWQRKAEQAKWDLGRGVRAHENPKLRRQLQDG